MEVHRQTCQACGSLDLRNILVRKPGQADMVYVLCASCRELVARYRLRDYYHHGKGAESFLRSVGAESSESGRSKLSDFAKVQEEALDGLQEALEVLAREGKEV